ncbi:MAG: hypothetical protein BM485_08420 [Desulfobulbaceae bacterium DB1]|nr:MAG: hypothetical protein BM485_08420 [Desulfobulbaceae bacterium DB1]
MKGLFQKILFYLKVIGDKRTPWTARFFVLLALVYLLFPQDLVPDIFPLFGLIDDATLAAILVWLSLRFVPAEVLREKRNE